MINLERRLESVIRDNLNKLPSEPFIWWRKTWWSRSAFLELAEECEELLLSSGFREGQRLALLLPNSPLLLALAFAVWRVGGAAVFIDFHSGYLPMMKQLAHADVFAALTYKGLSDFVPLVCEEGIPCCVIDEDNLSGKIQGRPCVCEDRETAAIFYTSGTTGEPKAVPLTHENFLSCIDGCFGCIDADEDDVCLNALPNSNSFGFLCGALIPLVKAIRQAVIPSFMPLAHTFDAIKDAEVTIIPAVPLAVAMMTRAAAKGGFVPKSLKTIISGAENLPSELAANAKKYLGVPVIQGYGLTEGTSVVAMPPTVNEARDHSVGKLISCIKAEIRGEDGEVLGAGSEGLLWIKGDSVARSYFRNDELTAERFSDGWFCTGDIAKFDEDGYLYLVGRTSELIFVGGFKVYAREVERVVEEHPKVEEAAIVGVPRPISGQFVKAVVVVKKDEKLTSKEIIDYCKKKLAYYKVPRIIEFVDKMPRSAMGEVVKRKLSQD
ncbi:MAG: AMP-binding protein [Synergistes sp.]|nr:AMP-binding protein [Synergistes sp.]